jgi:hypothetical protein
MRIAAIHQPQYLPYLGFFNKLARCDIFVALDHVQFQKNGLQNRNRIKTGSTDGVQWITVPVRHKHGQAINEVEVDSSSPWQKKHWNALVCNYSRARCFRTYAKQLQTLLFADYRNLSHLNTELIAWCMEALEIRTPVSHSSELAVGGRATSMLVDICRAVGADAYLSGPGGVNYMEPRLFEEAGIRVLWQDFACPTYEQQFLNRGFVPNLSVIDAVLNCGRDAVHLVNS